MGSKTLKNCDYIKDCYKNIPMSFWEREYNEWVFIMEYRNRKIMSFDNWLDEFADRYADRWHN